MPLRTRLRLAAFVLALAFAAVRPVDAYAGPHVVFDAGSGEVISENRAFDPWYPASLTKLMTAYVTFAAIRAGEVTAESPVVMTANAAKEPPSKMGFKPGTAITVDTALKILIVKSANDVAVALAEAVGGSESAFVARMNESARRLGMTQTRFANPHGLPDAAQRTTARDLGLLARAILREYPEQRSLFRITALELGGKVIRTHNHLLERYPGTDGMKTGFICASGFNVVTSASRNGRRLVAVVLGEPDAKTRAETTAALLETAFTSRGGLFSRRPTLESLRPSGAVPSVPANLREEICRRKDKGEDAEAEVGTAPTSYLVPRFELMPPVRIAVGAPVAAGAVPASAAGAATPLPRPNPARDPVSATALEPEVHPGAGLPPPPRDPPIEILGLKNG